MKDNLASFLSLRHAAAAGDIDSVQRLLLGGLEISEYDNAAMRSALRYRHVETVKLLLAAGANISENCEEFLRIAARNGDVDSLQTLLSFMKKSILPNILDHALYDAIASRNPQAVKILIETGANPTADDNRPIMEAASVGHVATLELLHQHGADIHVLDEQPIFNAVVEKHPHAVQFLLEAGAHPDAKLGITLLMAVSNGDTETLELLLRAGGKLPNPDVVANAADHDSLETLLILADHGYEYIPFADDIAEVAIKSVAPRILNFILKKSKVSQKVLNDGLEIVARHATENILDILLQFGADAGSNKSAALKIALKSQEFSMARKLLGANAHVPDLPGAVIYDVVTGGDWPLLVTLLQFGIQTEGIALYGMYAVELFNRVTPTDMLHDPVGNLLAKNIREDRQIFVKTAARATGQRSLEDRIALTMWLTAFLIETNSPDN